MADALEFDEGVLEDLEALYETESMTERRAFVRGRLDLEPGEAVLSVGTGPGFEPRGLARAVGEDGRVLGVDASETMLAVSRERCADLPQVELREGDATELPVEDASVGKAAAVQVYEYVPEVQTAAGELYRVLAPGGRAVVFDSDWDSVAYNVADHDRSARVLSAYDAHCPHPRIALTLGSTLRGAGFDLVDAEAFTHVETGPGGVGEQMADLVADFVGARSDLDEDTVAGWRADLDDHLARGEFFFSFSQYAFVVEKPE